MSRKHKLYYNRCIYNILGSNPNKNICPPKTITPNGRNISKPLARVRTKAVKRVPNGTGRRFG